MEFERPRQGVKAAGNIAARNGPKTHERGGHMRHFTVVIRIDVAALLLIFIGHFL